jgi:hypothetical protein
MDDLSDHLEQPSEAPRCARCTRSPRSAADQLEWATIDDDDVCPGCWTMADTEQMRNERS